MRNIYFIVFIINRYLVRKNTTNYSKSQQTTEAEAKRDTFCILTVKSTRNTCVDYDNYYLKYNLKANVSSITFNLPCLWIIKLLNYLIQFQEASIFFVACIIYTYSWYFFNSWRYVMNWF